MNTILKPILFDIRHSLLNDIFYEIEIRYGQKVIDFANDVYQVILDEHRDEIYFKLIFNLLSKLNYK